MAQSEHRPFVSILKAIDGVVIALYHWNHTEEDYEIVKTSGKVRGEEQANARLAEWATAYDAEIRQ